MATRLCDLPDAPPPPKRRSGLIGVAIAAAFTLATGVAATLPAPAAGTPTRPLPIRISDAPVAGGCTTPHPVIPVDTAAATRLERVLDRIDAALPVPGIGVAVIFPDGTAWTGARGYAETATRTPVTPDTAFAFASSGKTAIASLLLRAAERKELALTDRVADLLPDTPISARATVADVLRHRAGLGDYLTSGVSEAAMSSDPDRRLNPNDYLSTAGRPGRPGPFRYSNTGYLFAAALLEMGGERYLDRLHRELLEPYALCSIGNPALETVANPIARGYNDAAGDHPVASDPAMGPGLATLSLAGPAGGLVGTPLDLARMGAVLMGDHFLAAATRARAFPAAAGTYGLGFTRYAIAGRAVYGHDGRLGGARSAVRFDPASGIAVAVLFNRGDPSPDGAAALLLAAALATR